MLSTLQTHPLLVTPLDQLLLLPHASPTLHCPWSPAWTSFPAQK